MGTARICKKEGSEAVDAVSLDAESVCRYPAPMLLKSLG
jgi:hypothetical protein